ncbi:OmpH family outer membrane protein [Novosphingobium gossypii]|uniref:OmpH family outer membrane protein n=1 Tax=Novosphingobium gossypii TaxID=1604774 RepID=UPI003D202B05
MCRSVLSASALIGLVLAPAAAGQTTVPPAPAGQALGGPVVSGVCLLSREAIFANAAIGKAASTRLSELARTAQTEIDAQRKPLGELQDGRDDARTKSRSEALTTSWQALQLKADHNARELAATRAKALEIIAAQAQPVIAQVYGQKKCGLLLDRGTVLGGNFANDLTPDVVKGLDARVQTINLERERLPQQADTTATGPR